MEVYFIFLVGWDRQTFRVNSILAMFNVHRHKHWGMHKLNILYTIECWILEIMSTMLDESLPKKKRLKACLHLGGIYISISVAVIIYYSWKE